MKKKLIITYLFILLFLISNFSFSQENSKIDSLIVLLTKANLDSVKVDLYNELSFEFLYFSKDTSKLYAKHAISLAKEIAYQKGIAESHINIGNIANVDGNFNIAIEQFMKSMEIYQNLNDSTGIAETYSRLGLTHHLIGNYDNALKYNKKALNISKVINIKDIENIYNNIGLAYMMSENIDSALLYFKKSIIIASKTNNKSGVMYSYGNIANIYMSQEKFDKALDIYINVSKLSEELGDIISLSVSYNNISLVYFELGNQTNDEYDKKDYYKQSNENAEKALFYAEKVNSLSHMNYAYYQLAFSYKGLKDYKNAFVYAEKYINTTDSLYNINKVKEIENIEKIYKTEQQKIKLESIIKEKVLNEAVIKKQNQIILIGIFAFSIFLILLIFLFLLYRNNKKSNKTLNKKNEAIINQTSEIAMQRDKLSELAFELKKINRTKDKYFSIFAHDLKNPFQSILGFTELLYIQTDKDDFSNTNKYAKYIHESTQKTYTLLENMLNWARVQRGIIKHNPEKYNLLELINESIEITGRTASSKNISLFLDIDSEIEVFVDKYMFSTIIRNLISNAIKFTERGGKIFVKAEINNSDTINILVIDTGIGIKKENISKIFKLDHSNSTRGTENETGTGLGLPVCKEFAAKNNGELKVQSKVGIGSTFILTVPTNK